MRKSEIDQKKRSLRGMVKVNFHDGLMMFVNISDVVIQSDLRVKVASKRFRQSEILSIEQDMTKTELRRKTKHRTFTSMAARRRWLALHEMIEEKKEKSGDE